MGEDGQCIETGQENGCPEGQTKNSEGTCVESAAEHPNGCPEGKHMQDGVCVDVAQENACPEGQSRVDGVCVESGQENGCPDGMHKDSEGNCVQNAGASVANLRKMVANLSLRLAQKENDDKRVKAKEIAGLQASLNLINQNQITNKTGSLMRLTASELDRTLATLRPLTGAVEKIVKDVAARGGQRIVEMPPSVEDMQTATADDDFDPRAAMQKLGRHW